MSSVVAPSGRRPAASPASGSEPCSESWDAVVVGGGPAGSAAAFALAEAGRRALLLERRTAVAFKLGESLPPVGLPMAEHLLGPLDPSTEERIGAARTYGHLSCWAGSEPVFGSFLFSPHGHGLRLDRPRFDRALRERARAAGAEVAEGLAVTGIRRTGDWELELSGDARCRARYLIDASGRAAALVNRLGARRRGHDPLFAFAQIYALPPGAEDDDDLVRLEAGPPGWWYTVRLAGGRRLVVFHTDAGTETARRAARAEGFAALLAESRHVAPLLRELGYRAAGRPRGAPAGGGRLERFAGPGWLAAGDAAQAFDPLSSQGISTALRSGYAAGAAVARALAGDADAVGRYARQQEAVWRDYERHHRHFYNAQPRWPERPFWSRRRPRAGAAAGDLHEPVPVPFLKETPCDASPSATS